MNRPTMLITGGCSFSQVPIQMMYLGKAFTRSIYLLIIVVTLLVRAAGNELISHRNNPFLKLIEAIELGFNPEDILVAVMWSGCDRMHSMTTNFDKTWEEGTVLGPQLNLNWTTEPRQFQKEFYERDGIEVG